VFIPFWWRHKVALDRCVFRGASCALSSIACMGGRILDPAMLPAARTATPVGDHHPTQQQGSGQDPRVRAGVPGLPWPNLERMERPEDAAGVALTDAIRERYYLKEA
jgi:hypothetical protein